MRLVSAIRRPMRSLCPAGGRVARASAIFHCPSEPEAGGEHFEGRTEQQCWQAREWLSWEADHIIYVAKVRHSARFRASHPETIAEFRPRAEAALSFVDKTVKDQPFLVGDNCTIADIGCWGRMVFMSEGRF